MEDKYIKRAKSPCVRDCPDRSATCKLSCEKLKAYEKVYRAEREEIVRRSRVSSALTAYRIDTIFKYKRKKR